MAWSWHYETSDGAQVAIEVPGAATSFPTQSEAETWIGETWRDLLDGGADQAVLCEGERVVYRMGLAAE